MKRARTSVLPALVLGLFALFASHHGAQAGSRSWWFHVTVLETGRDGDSVRINLPANLIDASIPFLHDQCLNNHHLRVDGRDLKEADLRKLLAASREAKDGEYVRVDGIDQRTRVYKKGRMLSMEVEDRTESGGRVTIHLPLDVLEALLDGPSDQLDFRAAIDKLSNAGDGELVSVESDSATVRIWIDDRNTSH